MGARTASRAWLIALAVALHAAPAAGAQEDPPRTVSLAWAGDIAFSRAHGLPAGGLGAVLGPVRRHLAGVDVATGNLEGTLGRGGPNKCGGGGGRNCHAFQAPASYAAGLRRAGFDLVNLANNHTRDFGDTGLRQTVVAVRRAGLGHTGLGRQISVRRVAGVRVAFLGFAPYPWASPLTDIAGARRQVAAAARAADVVIVFMHAGAEGTRALHVPPGGEHAFGEYRGQTRRFARSMIDSGADAVLGSGPHVLRGIECRRGRPIAYSLGNFAAHRTLSTSGVLALSGILQLEVDARGRLVEGRLVPVRLSPLGHPRFDGSRSSIGLVRRLSRADFGNRACRVSPSGRITPPVRR